MFILVSLPYGILFGLNQTLLNENFINGKFVDGAYDILVNEVPKSILLPKDSPVTGADISQIASKVIQKEDLAKMTKSFVDQIKTVSGGDVEKRQITLSLDWLVAKRMVISEEISKLLFLKLPKCEDSKITVPSTEELKCVPKEIDEEMFKNIVGEELGNEMLKDIPKEFVFDVPQIIVSDDSVVKYFDIFKLVIKWGIVLLGFLLVLIGLFVFKPWSKVLKWESIALFISSLNLAFLMGALIFGKYIFDYLQINPLQLDLLKKVYELFIGTFAKNFLFYVIPVLVLSLIGWICGMIFERAHEKKSYGNK